VNRVDPRWLIGTGMVLGGLGSYAMTSYSLEINTFWIVWPLLLQGAGLGLTFVPLSTLAYATLPHSRMAEAAGLYSLVRTIGAAAGISIVSTVLTRQAQISWNELGAHAYAGNQALDAYLRHLNIAPNSKTAAAIVSGQIAQQAQMIALLDVFMLVTWSFVAMFPLVLLLKRQKLGAS
jgi:DHA2 family multidrug resistance protein